MSAKREAAVRGAVAKLDVTPEVREILVDIWREVDGAYAAQVKDLRARLKAARPHLEMKCPSFMGVCSCTECRAHRATDLSVKNWRKP